jgi:branched-chain amino acid aminotransferase
MTAVVSINGRMCGPQEAVVSVFDHGFLFGDGVYEVLRTYGRAPFLFEAHQQRLRDSAAGIALSVPVADQDLLKALTATVEALPGSDEAYVRIVLTRGVGELTYDPRACPTPTLVIITRALVVPPPEVYTEGVTVALVDVVRNHPEALPPRIKSNNLLNNALAMQAALRRGAFEALMRNYRGELAECSQSNVFLVCDGVLCTPPLEGGLLGGVTRAFVLDLARRLTLPVRKAPLYDGDLARASEVFLTSTTKEIIPVVRVDDRTIGSGTPGRLTRALLDAYRAHTTSLVALRAR